MGPGTRRLNLVDVSAAGEDVALVDVCLAAYAGAITVVYGAGSRVVVDLCAGNTTASSGAVYVQDVPLGGSGLPRELLGGVAWTGRDVRLLGVTGCDAVALPLYLLGVGRRPALQRAQALLAELDTDGLADQCLDDQPEEARWLVDLYRALAVEPLLLLVEDPWVSLATSGWRRRYLEVLVWAARRGCAVLMGTCDPVAPRELHALAVGINTQVLLLRHGRLHDDTARYRGHRRRPCASGGWPAGRRRA